MKVKDYNERLNGTQFAPNFSRHPRNRLKFQPRTIGRSNVNSFLWRNQKVGHCIACQKAIRFGGGGGGGGGWGSSSRGKTGAN